MAEIEETEAVSERKPAGFGGWLILPLIGLLWAPLHFIWTVARHLPAVAVRTPAHPLAAQTIFTVLVLPIVAFLVFCIVRFLQKRRIVPWLMTVLYGITLVFGVGLLIAHLKGYAVPGEGADPAVLAKDNVRTVIEITFSLIWILYFHNSVRVANTFTVVAPKRERPGTPKGLGGWLWLAALFLGFCIVMSAVGLLSGDLAGAVRYSIHHHHWPALAYDALRLVLILYSVFCLYALFRRWRAAIWLMPAGFVGCAGLGMWATAFKPISLPIAALFALPFVAFAIYFLASKRVKNTLIR